jgi:hypothetical protein
MYLLEFSERLLNQAAQIPSRGTGGCNTAVCRHHQQSGTNQASTVTAQNVISMLVLYHEHNGFAKIKLLGLFK